MPHISMTLKDFIAEHSQRSKELALTEVLGIYVTAYEIDPQNEEADHIGLVLFVRDPCSARAQFIGIPPSGLYFCGNVLATQVTVTITNLMHLLKADYKRYDNRL